MMVALSGMGHTHVFILKPVLNCLLCDIWSFTFLVILNLHGTLWTHSLLGRAFKMWLAGLDIATCSSSAKVQRQARIGSLLCLWYSLKRGLLLQSHQMQRQSKDSDFTSSPMGWDRTIHGFKESCSEKKPQHVQRSAKKLSSLDV